MPFSLRTATAVCPGHTAHAHGVHCVLHTATSALCTLH